MKKGEKKFPRTGFGRSVSGLLAALVIICLCLEEIPLAVYAAQANDAQQEAYMAQGEPTASGETAEGEGAAQGEAAEGEDAAPGESVAGEDAAQGAPASEEESPEDAAYSISPITSSDSQSSRGYDVVYVIDNSRSIWSQQAIRNQAVRTITNLAVGSDIRVGVVFFADHIYGTLGLTSVKTQEGSQTVLDFLDMTEQDQKNRDTNIGAALEAALGLFENQDVSRERIVILLSDGINENLAQNPAYKEAADELTRQQAAVLEQKGIPIYCVYLQKKRNDEEFLREIVNYFSEENSFDQERFEMVAEENISTLNDVFIDVFYRMQKDMKYRRIKLDSSGAASFYVPSVGNGRLQVYLNGDIQEGSTLYPPRDASGASWRDGSSLFLTYENPVTGEWKIQINSPDMDAVVGTIALYSDLRVRGEMYRIPDETDPKSKKFRLVLRCFDQSGQEIRLDNAVDVSTELFLTAPDGTTSSRTLEMTVEDGVAQSAPFLLDGYGDYEFQVNLSFEDFIDLDYRIAGGSVIRTAPVVKNVTGGNFRAEENENGYVFTIRDEELYDDPEGDEVFVVNVVQGNAANPVSVFQEAGYLEVTAQSAGAVDFVLQLQDSSGMTAEVAIKGRVIDVELQRFLLCLGILAVLALLAVVFLLWQRKKKEEQKLADLFARFHHLQAQLEASLSSHSEQPLNELHEMIRLILNGNRKVPGLVDMARELTEEQREDFGVNEFLAEKFDINAVVRAKAFCGIIRSERNAVEELAKKVKALEENPGNPKEAIANMEKDCREAEERKNRVAGRLLDLQDEMEKIRALEERMEEVAGSVDEMLSTPVRCDLFVDDISALPGAMGLYAATGFDGQYRRAGYELDQVHLLGYGKLGEQIGDTGIYVYGYEADMGGLGLQLRSTREFTCQSTADPQDVQTGRKAILWNRKEYQLTVNMEARKVTMILRVGQ